MLATALWMEDAADFCFFFLSMFSLSTTSSGPAHARASCPQALLLAAVGFGCPDVTQHHTLDLRRGRSASGGRQSLLLWVQCRHDEDGGLMANRFVRVSFLLSRFAVPYKSENCSLSNHCR